jgi:hypothetical protein
MDLRLEGIEQTGGMPVVKGAGASQSAISETMARVRRAVKSPGKKNRGRAAPLKKGLI